MISCPHCLAEIRGAEWLPAERMERAELVVCLEDWRARGLLIGKGQYGAGTVIQRPDGTWQGFVSRGTKDGKRRRRHVSGATEQEVRQKIDGLLGGKVERSGFRPLSNRSTAQLAKMYAEAVEKLGRRAK